MMRQLPRWSPVRTSDWQCAQAPIFLYQLRSCWITQLTHCGSLQGKQTQLPGSPLSTLSRPLRAQFTPMSLYVHRMDMLGEHVGIWYHKILASAWLFFNTAILLNLWDFSTSTESILITFIPQSSSYLLPGRLQHLSTICLCDPLSASLSSLHKAVVEIKWRKMQEVFSPVPALCLLNKH